MVQIKITLDEKDAEALLKLTGLADKGTAAGQAIREWLESKGHSPETKHKGRGGYRIENTLAYSDGYEWGKQAARENWDVDNDDVAISSRSAFEYWFFKNEMDLIRHPKALDEWSAGTRNGYAEQMIMEEMIKKSK